MGVPPNGWGNPVKIDDLGLPPFQETPISIFGQNGKPPFEFIQSSPILDLHQSLPTRQFFGQAA